MIDKPSVGIAPEIDIRKFLQESFDLKKKKNPRYSLRAYSKKIGLSHSALSQILSGNRTLTQRSLTLIIKKLKLDELTQTKIQRSRDQDPLHFTQIQLSQLEQLPKWYSDAILELFELEEFNDDPKWMAEKLGISIEECLSALAILTENQMISRNKKGKLKLNRRRTTTVGVPGCRKSIVEIQKQLLQKQIEILQSLPAEAQSSLGMTIAVDPNDLPQARQMIYQFITEFNRFLNRGKVKRREVFRLNMGFFPLSHSNKSKSSHS